MITLECQIACIHKRKQNRMERLLNQMQSKMDKKEWEEESPTALEEDQPWFLVEAEVNGDDRSVVFPVTMEQARGIVPGMDVTITIEENPDFV